MSRRPENGPVAMRPNRYLRLPPDIDDALEELAEELDKPIGRVIRDVLREGLIARGRLTSPVVGQPLKRVSSGRR